MKLTHGHLALMDFGAGAANLSVGLMRDAGKRVPVYTLNE